MLPKTKPHYEVLDGLRGVAAVVVLCFHLLEAHASSPFNQLINHGYLAVDFFFVLSGFVIGYAYDDSWGKMTLKDFFKRRLIRLQPMIIIGSIIGAILFYFGAGDNIEKTSIEMLIFCTLAGCLMIPLSLNFDIRGWNEMYPLNGPQWTLFFEYIANLFYALFIRHFSKKLLSICVILCAFLTIYYLYSNPNGSVVGGWSLTQKGLFEGMSRLLYPFFIGLLLARVKLSIHLQHPFLFCTLAVVLLLAMPRIGDENSLWLNAAYECVCILLLFPLIVIVGASTKKKKENHTNNTCSFLGKISYPLYLVHYPFVYIYFQVVKSGATKTTSLLLGIGIVIFCLILAWACERFYDAPLRKWLQKKIIR